MKRKVVAVFVLCMVALLVISGCSKDKTGSEAGKKVVVGLDDTFVPMGFKDDNGEIVGFDVDLAKEIFKREGMDVKFQPIDWTMKEMELNAGNIDAIWNGYTITEERKEKVDFSTPYLENRQVIITLSDTNIATKADLKGKVVGIQDASSSLDAINKEPDVVSSIKGGKPVLFETNNQALMDLEAGRVVAVVADEILARYYIAKRGENKYKILDENFGSEEYGIGIKKGNKELLDKINKQLAAMKQDGTFDKIYQKWFGDSAGAQ